MLAKSLDVWLLHDHILLWIIIIPLWETWKSYSYQRSSISQGMIDDFGHSEQVALSTEPSSRASQLSCPLQSSHYIFGVHLCLDEPILVG